MHVFVSYAKGDIAVYEPERLAILAAVARAVTRAFGRAFVHELHNSDGGHAVVATALESATGFCTVQGPGYVHRRWTRWEYGRASRPLDPDVRDRCEGLAHLPDACPSAPTRSAHREPPGACAPGAHSIARRR
jgi:hypothetical protein